MIGAPNANGLIIGDRDALLAAIVDSSFDAIVAKTLDGTITSWNAAAERMYGFSRQEAVGQPISIIVPPERAGELSSIFERLQRGEGIAPFETVRQRKDGRRIHVYVTISPVLDDSGVVAGASAVAREVTEERGALEAWRAAEERLNLALEAGRMGTWQWSIATGEVVWSQSLERIHGLEPGSFGGRIEDVQREVHPADREHVRASIARAVQGERYHVEYRIVRPDGEIAWVEARGSLVLGTAGDPVRMIGTCMDITARKRTEARIAAEHGVTRILADARSFEAAAPHILRTICQSLDAEVGALWLPDHENRVLRCAVVISSDPERFGPFLAASRERGLGFGEGLPGSAWQARTAMWNSRVAEDPAFVRAREAAQVGLRVGAAFPISSAHELFGVMEFFTTYAARADDQLLSTMSAIASEVAQFIQRRRAEEALQESERRFRELADAMPQIVWSAAADGKIDYHNRRYYEFTGFPAGQVGGREWSPTLHPDDAKGCIEAWQGCVARGEAFEREYRLRDRVTGRFRWHLARALPMRDPQGNIVRWFGTSTDIDDQKRLQEELREGARRKDEFLAMLAHELRTPMAPLRNSLHISRQPNATAEQLAQARDTAERQVAHLDRVVDDLLDVSRLTRGKILLKTTRLDVVQLARTLIEDHRSLFEERGLTVTLHLPDAPLWVLGDRTRISQIVSNLLENAVKFTDSGGYVTVRVAREGQQALIAVRDTGIGMDRDTLERVFEPFSQADHSLDRSRGGLGLGLAVVKGFSELHGGSVAARSDGIGRGSELFVRLPLAGEQYGEEAVSPPLPKTAARRVLIIEDNLPSAESLSILLQLAGHTVAVAHEGESGLEQARRFHPEIVLCDIGLPGAMDGYEVARVFRRDDELRWAYLVALTGYGQAEDQRRAWEAGFDAHLVKPADLDELWRLLSMVSQPESRAANGA